MKYWMLAGLVCVFGAVMACAPSGAVAPSAAKKPHTLELHGDVRTDNYYWLRERENPEVLAYLEAENAYTETVMVATEGLQNELFEELKNRIQPDDSSVPALFNGYYYYERFEEGGEYPCTVGARAVRTGRKR